MNDAGGGFAVGRRLRQLREAFALSQRELARRAGMTNASLSMIEQGKVSPSLSTLERLLSAVPFPLQAFFSDMPVTARPVFDLEEHTSCSSALRSQGWQTVLSGGQCLAMHRLTLAEQSETDFSSVAKSALLMGFVISGTPLLVLGDDQYPMRKSTGFQFQVERRHRLFNSHTEPAVFALTILHCPS